VYLYRKRREKRDSVQEKQKEVACFRIMEEEFGENLLAGPEK
jgi:hypothetical protein